MGGNALSTQTERMLKDEFCDTQIKFALHVTDQFPNTTFHFVQSYRNKQSHGDMDVLIKKGTVDKWDLVNSFNPSETYNNGDIVSLDWEGSDKTPFQLDLVFTNSEYWEMQKAFTSFNDLGNLMGKIARFLRFKYGFQGLRYTSYYSKNRSVKLGQWVVSRDPEPVFEFLGFDWARFKRGFNDLEDVFEYVRSSQYFNHGCFMPKNLTADQRHRDTKRSTYKKWINYLETVPVVEKKRPTREDAVQRAKRFFGINLRKKEKDAARAYERRLKARETFNGNVAMDNFDLRGKELGKALGNFKNQFENSDAYHEYLMNHTQKQVLSDFRETL